jgi:cystathionine beta-synthase
MPFPIPLIPDPVSGGGVLLSSFTGEDFIPPIADFSLTTGAYTINDDKSFSTARRILREEGILIGSSSGTLISGALKYCRSQTRPKNVVTFVCDTGNKYISKMFNESWLKTYSFSTIT